MMSRKCLVTVLLSALFVNLSLLAFAASTEKDVTRKGNLIIVSKRFADAVKKDNTIVLSTVAVKSRLNQSGQLQGYQLFQIDRSSPVEQMGFRAKDVMTGVNGIPARELEANRQSLEKTQRFDVTFLRNSKEKKIRIEIR
jgi:S1-C subfamily serine protease